MTPESGIRAVISQYHRATQNTKTTEAAEVFVSQHRELADSLRELLDWCREYTSPLQPNSPHEILVKAHNLLERIK